MKNAYSLPVNRKELPSKRKVEMEFDSNQLVSTMFVKDATHLTLSVKLLCQQFLLKLFLKEPALTNNKKLKNGNV